MGAATDNQNLVSINYHSAAARLSCNMQHTCNSQ